MNLNLKEINNVYFIGIGGIGMSALARYFNYLGKNVAGYDKTQTPLTDELESLGISIHFKDDVTQIPDNFLNPVATLVIFTPAVPKTHSEYQFFDARAFNLHKRSEVLGFITKDSFCFAVAGTHGKTTTTSILAHLLHEVGAPMTAFLGGISEDFKSNFVFRGTEYSVVEADEYDRSFLRLSPSIACITSMDADHLDIYGSAAALKDTFHEFASKLKAVGKLIVHESLPINGVTYGITADADYSLLNIKVEQGTYIIDVKTPFELIAGVQFSKPGRHNLLNALAAFAMASEAGFSTKALAEALATFKGVQRRFSYIIKENHFAFIDDYAHHPKEIEAVHQAVSEMHPGAQVLVVFQPHLFSRTKDFADGFASSLSKFDMILLLEIYPARETPIEGITSRWLLEKIENPHKKLVQKEDLVQEIKQHKTDILITLGAGDIGLEVPKIKSALAYAS